MRSKVVPTFFFIQSKYLFIFFTYGQAHEQKKRHDRPKVVCLLTQSLIFFCLCFWVVSVCCTTTHKINKVDNEIDKENILEEIK